MKTIIKKGLMAISASLLLISASGTAHAIVTAGGATVHNAATLTFTGGSVTASVDVKVNTIAAAPTITVDLVAQSVNGGGIATYVYTITNNANGTDTLSFAAASGDAGVAGAPTLNVNGTGLNNTSLTLGGSIASTANTVANTIVIPAGSQLGFVATDVVNIGGNLYTVTGVTTGTIANTPGATTNAEIPAVVTVTPVGASPVIAIGAATAGTHIGEVQTFNTVVTASTPSVVGVNGTHTVNLTGNTTAVTQGLGGAAVTYITSAGSGNETITTVLSSNVGLIKDVRNVTQGVAAFATAAVTAQSGDTLEYRLTATELSGGANALLSVLKDEVPPFTTYVAGSTTLNGVAVVDGPLATLPLTNANAGLQINSAGAAAGTINAGTSATVLFQVTVD